MVHPEREHCSAVRKSWESDSSPRLSADLTIPRVWKRQIQEQKAMSPAVGEGKPLWTELFVVEEYVVNSVAVTLSQPPWSACRGCDCPYGKHRDTPWFQLR